MNKKIIYINSMVIGILAVFATASGLFWKGLYKHDTVSGVAHDGSGFDNPNCGCSLTSGNSVPNIQSFTPGLPDVDGNYILLPLLLCIHVLFDILQPTFPGLRGTFLSISLHVPLRAVFHGC